MHREQVKVLLIGGYGRSGSTLLDRLLGQIEGFVSVGEMRYLWEWGLKESQLCGCGNPFLECSFWRQVLEDVFGCVSNIDVDRMVYLKRRVERRPDTLRVLFPRLMFAKPPKEFLEYATIMERLYGAIAAVSGGRVVVDSSKHPSRGFLLAAMPSVQLHTVHLVRDSRAVAYSWQRKRIRPEVHWKTEYMDVHGLLRCVAHWIGHNRLTASLRQKGHRYTLVRYEDLVTNPRDVLSAVVRGLGGTERDFGFLKHELALLKTNHTVAGNPMRFSQGPVPIVLDDEWRSKMPFGKKLAVTACTWPFLLRYGYSILGRARKRARML